MTISNRSAAHCTLLAAALTCSLGAQAGVVELDFSQARVASGGGGAVVLDQAIGGRTGVTLFNAAAGGVAFATAWGTAVTDFGMNPGAFQGVGGWAGGEGALLSDITSVSFDWYRETVGQLGGGFRMSMYVYSPESLGDTSGFLLFDGTYALDDTGADEWNSTGNFLTASGPLGEATYSADYGSSAFSGRQSWADIQTALAGWFVYEIGIVNDAGYTAYVDNFRVGSGPAVPEPASLSLVALAGAVALGMRRRRGKALAAH